MMTQKLLLSTYMKMFNSPTLKQISHHTGIQVTRVFRIMNGQEMKLSEYEIFNNKLRNDDTAMELLRIVDEGLGKLSTKNIKEVHDYINAKILLSEFQI